MSDRHVRLAPCPGCARHVRIAEAHCPFCDSALGRLEPAPDAHPSLRLSRLGTLLFGTSLTLSLTSTFTLAAPADARARAHPLVLAQRTAPRTPPAGVQGVGMGYARYGAAPAPMYGLPPVESLGDVVVRAIRVGARPAPAEWSRAVQLATQLVRRRYAIMREARTSPSGTTQAVVELDASAEGRVTEVRFNESTLSDPVRRMVQATYLRARMPAATATTTVRFSLVCTTR